MVKYLHLLALVANSFCLTLCSEVYSSSSAQASATSSLASASSYSSSYSSNKNYYQPKEKYCQCGPYEREVPCPEAVCVPKTCDEVGFPILCYDLPPNGQCPSPPACICIEDYVRNDKGECIPIKDCPSCGGDPNAQSGCGVNCNNRCGKNNNNTCIDICYFNSCDCKKGFLLDETCNKCVKPSQCPPPKCKKNEVYDLCPAPCPLRTCGINDAAVDCVPALEVGDPKCPPPKCRCDDGFYKNDVGECVRLENCPKCPRRNEVYDPCIAPCPPRRCDVDDRVIICGTPPTIGDDSCKSGCRCADGFYRNAQGFCVKRDECPLPCKPGEVYAKCPQFLCKPLTCSDIGFNITCPTQEYGCPGNAACICADDKVRDDNGNCIPRNQCPSCGGDPNALAGCGVYCNKRCRDIGKEPGVCVAVCKENACDCKKDFYLDENTGKCVPSQQCTPQCGANEEYNDCINGGCQAKNCSQAGFPIPCPKIDSKKCIKGCLCKSGYLRNDKGICIPKNECPSCGGDKNAQPGCGINCNKQCSDLGNKEPNFCITLCKENSCDCKKGYYYDPIKKRCVKPEDCTPTCGINEVYSNCTQANCNPQNCTQLGYPLACPSIDPKYCKSGCLCKPGFVRNAKGVCIPSQECPSCGGDENAQSGCGGECRKRCSDIGKDPRICTLICEFNACNCKNGYVIDDNTGKCIKEENCPQKCGINEEYSNCTQSNCSPQNCTQLGYPLSCPRVDPNFCKSGCLCKPGFVRNAEGVCIPSQECPSCGGDKNAQSGCGGPCRKRCSDIGKDPRICTLVCEVNACNCRPGYVIDDYTGKCVKEENCPLCGDDVNAVPGCGINCNKQCSDIGKQPGACITLCKENACECKKGYYYDPIQNRCVKAEDCTQKCGINEEYSNCTQSNCSPQNCTQLGYPLSCPRVDPNFCKSGCLCKPGFVRNAEGVCIPSQECPSCGGDKNAQSGCGGPCRKRCSDIGKDPRICTLVCEVNACNCRPGYVIDDYTGKCVKEENCPLCGDDVNAVPGCGINCNKQCSDIGKQPGACITLCKENACECKKGYYYDPIQNRCVKAEDCTQKCGINEEYSNCTQSNCSPQNCTQLGYPLSCPRVDPNFCKSGCLCKPGFVRNAEGVCIPSQECPSCGGDKNAQSGCGGPCRKRCSDIGKDPRICTLVCEVNACNCRPGYVIDDYTGKCVKEENCPLCGDDVNAVPGCGINCNKQCSDIGKQPGACITLCKENACECKKGYYYDPIQNRCVKAEDCTPKCGINEEYNECTNRNCAPQNCAQVGFPIPCPAVSSCVKGCQCKSGYVKNDKGICIPAKECPSCGGDPNAEYGCGGYCDKRCSDAASNVTRPCILICKLNGCDCKEGYYRDDNTNQCVKLEDCSPKCLPENNEIFSECINGGCNRKNCSQYGKPVPCVKLDPKACKKGCICKEGYLRASNGQCIPQNSCPEACNGPHEQYNNCSYNCPPQTCDSLDKAYACPIKTGDNCKPMCKCEPGYYRNKIGQCITEEQCRKCNGPHEYYSCGGACDNVCATLKKENQTNCPIVNIKCNERCYCEKDFARALNGTCIPITSCNEPQCPVNERFEKCPGSSCQPLTCSQLGEPILCPDKENSECLHKPGCVCIDGFVRNDQGKCIPIEKCPSCGNDPNAQSGCGVNCGKYCKDLLLNEEDGISCIEVCYFNSCDCKDGYYFDTNQEKCVPPGQCTDICGKNEMFEDCSNPICRAKNCSEVGFPIDCNEKCKKGCICKDDYVRNEKGICVPAQECPSCGGDPNAVSGCGVNCGKLCPNNNRNPNICPRICYPNACDCKDGFYFDNNTKTCVKKEECSPRCNELNNEVFDSCIEGGCDKKNCSQLGRPDICLHPLKCTKGCKCKEGYLRRDNGTCVPIDQCPTIGCGGDPNAEPGCGFNCGKKCPRETSPKLCPRIVCKPDKCDCKKGFLYDSNLKKCVKQDDCTPKCNQNERFEKCPQRVCEPQTCSAVGYPKNCTTLKDCDCGYPTCICDYNYARNSEGVCIPIQQCEKCTGPNEYFSCGPYCDNVCSKLDTESKDNCPVKTFVCVSRCYCDDGYARNDKGICIPISKCPGRNNLNGY